MEKNMVMITDPKTFSFDFDWPKYFDENFMHGIEFIIKINKYLTGDKVKNKIELLLLKYTSIEHGTHEHRKQQKE